MNTILIVDDSPIDRAVMTRLLAARESFEVIQADDGADALQLLKEKTPQLIVTDMQMPNVNGLQLIESVARHQPDLPVILITARGSEQLAVQALEKGAASYVPKTRLADDLISTVNRVLHTRRSNVAAGIARESLIRTQSEYVFGNSPELLTSASEVLTQQACSGWSVSKRELLRLQMTLEEALRNALYHGNLSLDPRLREADLALYHQLAAQRATEDPWSERRIHVCAEAAPDTASWEITDDGNGFDFERFTAADQALALQQPFGRGIVLMRSIMDDVEFLDGGRTVRLTKKKASRPTGHTDRGLDEDQSAVLSDAGYMFDLDAGEDEL